MKLPLLLSGDERLFTAQLTVLFQFDRSLRLFPITLTELKLMAKAASIGLNKRPNTGKRTPAAIGTPKTL